MWNNTNNDSPSVYEQADNSYQEQQKIDLQKQNTELRKEEVQIQKQAQQTNTMLATGGLVLGGILVLVVSVYLVKRMLNRKK